MAVEVTMSTYAKQLHLHSLPIFVLVITLSGILAMAVMAQRGDGMIVALVHPVLKTKPVIGGVATLAPNSQPAIEAPGASDQIADDTPTVGQAVDAGQSVVLQLALGQATQKAGRR
jgi:hypothetical protein